MKNKLFILLNGILVISVAFCIYKTMSIPDVRYVKSADLIYSYEGMKDAQKKQEKVMNEVQSNLDTLQLDFQKAVNNYNQDFPKLSKDERIEREKLLSLQQNNLQQYSKNAEDKIKTKDEQITQGVLNQVNSFVEEYAKKKGYDIVLGTTTSGNILFAREQMDITDEVLKALNENYKTEANTVEE